MIDITNGHGIAIGVGKDLAFTINDAKAIREIFTSENSDYSFDVANFTLLVDKDATKENIVKAFKSCKCSINDPFIFYFSGHGISANLETEPHIAPFDGITRDTATNEFRQYINNCISSSEISRLISGVKAKLKIIILDCCYAEAQYKFTIETVDTSKILFLASSRVNQISRSQDFEKSLFTNHILDLFSGECHGESDGFIKVTSAISYLTTRLSIASATQQFHSNFKNFDNIKLAKSLDKSNSKKTITIDENKDLSDDTTIEIKRFIDLPSTFINFTEIVQNFKDNYFKKSAFIYIGISRSGKTYLGKRLVQELASNIVPLWITFPEMDSYTLPGFLNGLYKKLRDDLKIETAIEGIINTRHPTQITEDQLSLIAREIDLESICFVFDNFHHAGYQVKRFISKLLAQKNIRIIILAERFSRDLIEGADDNIMETNMPAISEEHIGKYLTNYGCPVDEGIELDIFNLTKGFPFALWLFANLVKRREYSIDEILRDENSFWKNKHYDVIIERLFFTKEEEEIIFRLSLVDIPLDRSILDPENQYESEISRLLNDVIIVSTVDKEDSQKSKFGIGNSLIRHRYRNIRSAEQTQEIKHELAELLMKRNDSLKYKIQSLHLFISLKKLKEVIEVYNGIRTILISNYEMALLKTITGKFEEEFGAIHLTEEMRLDKAIYYEIVGEWDQSIALLDYLVSHSTNTEIFFDALNRLLLIYNQRNDYKLGLELIEKESIKKNIAPNDSQHWAEFNIRLGRFYHELSRFDEGLHHYGISMELSKTKGYKVTYVKAQRQIGVINWFKGNYEGAITIFNEIIPVAEHCDKREWADCYKHLGIALFKLGKREKADDYLEKSINSFRQSITIADSINYLHGKAWTTMNMSDTLMMQGYTSNAKQNLESAYTMFTNLNEKNGLSNTLRRKGEFAYLLGEREDEVNHFKDAVDCLIKSRSLAREIKTPLFEAETIEILYKVNQKLGRHDDNVLLLEQYRDLCRIHSLKANTL